MFILFDGVNGSIRFFENDVEKKHIHLGNDFVNKDLYLTVQFGCKGNQVDIINRPDVSIKNKSELDLKKISKMVDLRNEDAIQLLEQI